VPLGGVADRLSGSLPGSGDGSFAAVFAGGASFVADRPSDLSPGLVPAAASPGDFGFSTTGFGLTMV
jgi:hypothetical protein